MICAIFRWRRIVQSLATQWWSFIIYLTITHLCNDYASPYDYTLRYDYKLHLSGDFVYVVCEILATFAANKFVDYEGRWYNRQWRSCNLNIYDKLYIKIIIRPLWWPTTENLVNCLFKEANWCMLSINIHHSTSRSSSLHFCFSLSSCFVFSSSNSRSCSSCSCLFLFYNFLSVSLFSI